MAERNAAGFIVLGLIALACNGDGRAAEGRVEPPQPARRTKILQPAAAPTVETVLEPAPAPVELQHGTFNSARACGACHEAIFARWSRSMHSSSYIDPVFREALFKAHEVSDGKASPTCLRCHSPTVSESRDVYGMQEVTHEGVTCDFCHSVGALTTDSSGTHYQLDWSGKHGPYGRTHSPAHRVAQRPFFERSELCAGCHDMSAPDGTMVLATYSEWKASAWAEQGTQCHDCHMPRIPGDTVTRSIESRGHDVIDDHRLPGAHEPSLLQRAVKMRLESLTRDADRVRAVVTVENSGAGHYVPTGIPSRRLVLSVRATQRQRVVFERQLTYQRVMQGDDDRTLTEDWEIKLLSRRVLRDNRLAPLEVRRETFVFDAAPDEQVDLTVRLSYVRGNAARHASVIAALNEVLRCGASGDQMASCADR